MPREETASESRLSRRKVIALSATGGLALAGCLGGSDSDESVGNINNNGSNNNSNKSSGGLGTQKSSSDAGSTDGLTFIASEQRATDKAQYNPFNATNQTENVQTLLYQSLGKFLPRSGEFEPLLAKSWDIGSSSATITLRDDVMWTNPDADVPWSVEGSVTADDLLTRLRLGSYFGLGIWNYVKNTEKQNKRTVKLQFDGEVNKEAFKNQLLPTQVSTPKSLYREYLDQLSQAESEQEKEAAKQELVNWTLRKPPSNGPVQWTNATPNSVTLSVRDEGHPAVDELNFDAVEWLAIEHQQGVARLINHQLDDFTGLVTQDIADKYPDWVTLTRFPVFYGMTVTPNHNHPVLKKRNGRMAIAHVINRTTTTENSSAVMYSSVAKPHGVPGTLSGLAKQRLGDTYNQLTTYGYKESKMERAAEHMREAGYEKTNGTWKKPNGKDIKFKVMAPVNWSWVRAGQTITDSLKEFGFKVNFVTKEAATLYGTTQPKGNYDLITGQWGTYTPYPANSFTTFVGLDKPQIKRSANIPTELEVPMPVGDPSGSLEKINVEEKVNNLTSTSGDEATKIIKEIAWAINQGLPKIPVNEKLDQRSFDSTEWDLPEKDSPAMGAPQLEQYLFNKGLISNKQE